MGKSSYHNQNIPTTDMLPFLSFLVDALVAMFTTPPVVGLPSTTGISPTQIEAFLEIVAEGGAEAWIASTFNFIDCEK